MERIIKQIKRPLEDPAKWDSMNYFVGIDLSTIASRILEDRAWTFREKWKDREWSEAPDTWEKRYCELREETRRARTFDEFHATIHDPAIRSVKAHIMETIKEYLCWRQYRERYPILREEAKHGDQEAIAKLDLIFTKAGHLRLKVLGEFDRKGPKQWNEDVTWWILEHRDLIPNWKRTEVIERMEKDGVKQGLEPIPEDTKRTGWLMRGEEYQGHNREKFTERIRKILNEMQIRSNHVK